MLDLRRDPADALSERVREGLSDPAEVAAVDAMLIERLGTIEPGEHTDVLVALAGAFERAWQPGGQPVPEPAPAMRDAIVTQMNRLYYHVSRRTWKDTFYRGVPLYKCPTDMWVYQELIHDLRPGLVIETGTFRGGSALFVADRLEENGRGEVVTIDVTSFPDLPQHPRLSYLVGSSTSQDVVAEVLRRLPSDGSPVLVILDSDHRQTHVADELRAYAPMVTAGSYLIVEDTNVNGHPVAPQHGPGPWEAVRDFLSDTDGFEVDHRGERYFLTQNPSGYLRRREDGDQSVDELSVPAATRPSSPVEMAKAALDAVRIDARGPAVVLVLPGVRPGQMFAGIRTAIVAGGLAAARLGRPLRIVTVDQTDVDWSALLDEMTSILRAEGLHHAAARTSVSVHGHRDFSHHGDDVWVATFWTTAVAVKSLVDRGVVDRRRVVYLVQDYEPAFHPWGHDFVQARATYDFGFAPLVNSSSLAAFLRAEGAVEVEDQFVFGPTIETEPLEQAASRWTPEEGVLRVLFYARPSKPRNLYRAGVEGLRLWADGRTDAARVKLTLAGEPISVPPYLGDAVDIEVLGKLSFEAYYEQLASTDVGLALMLSPHPSHLALELPMAGVPTVTNSFLDARTAWTDDLFLADPGPEGIADALAVAASAAQGRSRHVARGVPKSLGGSLDEAVRARIDSLG